MENTIFNGKIHYKWPFSIAFCMFTRGYICCGHPWNLRESTYIKADMWNCHGASWVLLRFFGSGKFGAGWVMTFRKIWQFLAGCIINGWIFLIKSRTNTGKPWFLLPKSRGKPLNLPISSLNNSRCLRVAEYLILTTGCPRVYHLKTSLLVKHIFSMVSWEYHGKFMG